MSIYEDELRRRIMSGEDIEETATWFINVVAADKELRWSDMSPLELLLMKDVREAVRRWLKNRRLN